VADSTARSKSFRANWPRVSSAGAAAGTNGPVGAVTGGAGVFGATSGVTPIAPARMILSCHALLSLPTTSKLVAYSANTAIRGVPISTGGVRTQAARRNTLRRAASGASVAPLHRGVLRAEFEFMHSYSECSRSEDLDVAIHGSYPGHAPNDGSDHFATIAFSACRRALPAAFALIASSADNG